MPMKKPNVAIKLSVRSCRSNVKTRLRKGRKTSGDVDSSSLSYRGTAQLEDMPVDVLAKIFDGYRPFKYMEQVEEFGENFEKASAKLLQAGYLQMERDLPLVIADVRKRFAETLQDEDSNKDMSNFKKKMLCKSILQLETLSSTFAHVNAIIMSYTSAGIWSHYDGELLDYFVRAKNSIMTASKREPATKSAPDGLILKCRALAAAFIWTFLLEVEENTLGNDRKKVDILGAISLLNTLLCCKDSRVSASLSKDKGLAKLAADFSIPNCWMGFFAAKGYSNHPAEIKAVDAIHVLRQLVWVSNNEYHLNEWQKTLKSLNVAQPKIPKSMSILLGEGSYRNDGKTGRWFDSMEVDPERVFYFGLHSLATYRTSGTPTNDDSEDRIRLVDRVVTIPKDLKDAVLEVKLEITCEENLLPATLCQRLFDVDDGRTLPVGLQASFVLRIASHENASRTGSKVCEFPCYAKGWRPRGERLLIGDHGWKMLEVGDNADKHKIYESEGKIALESSKLDLSG